MELVGYFNHSLGDKNHWVLRLGRRHPSGSGGGDWQTKTGHAWPWLAACALASTLGVAGWPQWWWYRGMPFKSPDALADALEVLQVAALLLWWRPMACFVVAEGAMLAYGVLAYPSIPADYAALVATAVGAWGVRRAADRYIVFAVALGGMVGVAE